MNKKYKIIPGYENYFVTVDGDVFSNFLEVKKKSKGNYSRPIRKLKPDIRNGYCHVTLSKDGVQKRFRLHRLVAKAFIPNPENKPHINHKNGIKDDNRVENLEWCTNSENQIHAVYELKSYYVDKPKKVVGYDKHTGEKIVTFRSSGEAGRWLISKGYTKDKTAGKSVGKCARGQIPSYLGFIWKRIT